MAVKTVQAIVDGQTYDLTYNSQSRQYEATITAPQKSSYNQSKKYYPVIVKATDDAGNVATVDDESTSIGEKLRLYVKETTKPVITATYPTQGNALPNNSFTITWKVTDNDSGIDPNTIGITIDGNSKITGSSIIKQVITGGYNCSYAPPNALTDGNHTIVLDCSDYDGNTANAVTITFKVDTVAPSLTVQSPAENLVTNKNTIIISGTTSDATSGIESATVTLNGGQEQSLTILNSEFNMQLTLTEGTNTIVISVTDNVGRVTTVTRTVKYDSKGPVISSPKITPNQVTTGEQIKISCTVVDQ